MNTLWQDLRYAIRGFRRSLAFTLAAIFALALGIGANTAMFSAVNAILLNSRALNSLKDPSRLVLLWEKNPRLSAFFAQRVPVCIENYLEWKKQSRSFADLALFGNLNLDLTSGHEASGAKPEQIEAVRATSNTLPLFGVEPRLGRNFKPEEMQPGKGRVAILSDDLWRSRFQSDPSILGKTLVADALQYQIIGVLPPQFEMPAVREGMGQLKPKLWIPINIAPGPQPAKQFAYYGLGRLKPGVSLARAQAEMNMIGDRLQRADPDLNTGWGINVFPLSVEDVGPELRKSLVILQVAVGFVLLIACANVANLMLTRAVQREKEIALRIALGAPRTRIARQLLSESVLLSCLGGVAGLLLAFGILRLVSVLAPSETHGFHELRIDPLVLVFTILTTVAAGILFGLAPALHALRQSIGEALGHGARTVGGTSKRLRGALVIAEIALSLILLIGAGLMIRSLMNLMGTDMGFRPDHVLTMNVALPQAKYSTPERVASFDDRLLAAVRQLPGVSAATLTDALPMRSITQTSYGLEGKTAKPGEELITDLAHVEGGYLETLGLKLFRGRTIETHDVLTNQLVALVNQAFAQENWPKQDALGKSVYFGSGKGKSTRYSVVGIVSDERQFGPDAPSHTQVYLPQHGLQSAILVARTTGDPLAMTSAVESQVWNLDKDQPVAKVESMESVLREWTAPRRFNMTVLLNFAAVALLLAAVGLYGVLAYSVGLRTREIGVRVAMGAEPARIARLIVGEGFRLVIAGAVVGLAGAYAVTRFLRSLIYGVSAMDPETIATVTAALMAVAFVATYFPARRAARTDPMEALRTE